MNETEWQWAVPLVFVGAGLVASDQKIENHVPTNPSLVSHATTFSNAGLAVMLGTGAGLFLVGHHSNDDQERETGLLSGEAAMDAYIDTEIFSVAAGRNRPFSGPGAGRFFDGGDSFPSQHAAISWAVASVIAHEYPGFLTQLLAYGAATGISAARVVGQKHYASDVVIGSALGWYLGRQVFRSHSRYSDAEMNQYGRFMKNEEIKYSEADERARKTGSAYIPLESWVYPAVEKLESLGYLQFAFRNSRPWTRIEVASLVNEAKINVQSDDNVSNYVSDLELELEREFAPELSVLKGNSNEAARIESLYTRIAPIHGPPLNDSYHFGQTIINDYGRPYQEGFNTDDGFSTYGTAGPFAFYVRGEYQHAPSASGYSAAVLQAIAAADQTPVQPSTPVASVDHFALLDTYAAAKAAGWNLSFGKQSLWWGPADGGALLFSDNAEPIYTFRANKTFTDLPWILKWMGTVKLDAFFGKLSGNQFPPRPLIHGEKLTFKPLLYWEIGIERTSEFGGVGRALTPGAVWESYVATKSSFEYPANRDPGKRTIGFDFSYQVRGLRNWLTLYADALLPEANPFNLDNDQSPIYGPRRTAIRSGIYLPQIPHLQKLDFHLESVYTDPPTPRSVLGDYVYWDGFYKDLYTNKRNLIGDWIGREGMGFQSWANYSFTPRSSLQFNYRHAKVDKDFIPGGETLNDGSVRMLWWFRRQLSFSGALQYEKWTAPLLASTPQSNWTSTVEVTYWPKSWHR